MEASYLSSTREVLKHFHVSEESGLSDAQVNVSKIKYGRNGIASSFPTLKIWEAILMFFCIALPEDPPTPLWKLVLEQFKDQLVIILLGSAAISFVLALFEDGEGWTAFVDPLVVGSLGLLNQASADKLLYRS